MKTNIDLDEQLVQQGFAITELRTKKELVNFALPELVILTVRSLLWH